MTPDILALFDNLAKITLINFAYFAGWAVFHKSYYFYDRDVNYNNPFLLSKSENLLHLL